MPDFDAAKLRSDLADRYRIEELIGSGGMAFVFRATDLRHQRSVALKVLRPDIAFGVGTDRFLREMRITAKLSHPNIVPLFDSGDTAGHLWFTMPLIQGESLRSRLNREGQLAVDAALAITRDVASALDYAHACGVLHRDIKPENVLLVGGHALVADFGIARAASEIEPNRLTGTGVVIGTALYMSPEQSGASPRVGPQSDFYSLACVLYEMLTGEPPWNSRTLRATLARRLTEPPTPIRILRPLVPQQVDDAVARALTPVPADRFPNGTAFVEALTTEAPTRESFIESARTIDVPRKWRPIAKWLIQYIAVLFVGLQLISSIASTLDLSAWLFRISVIGMFTLPFLTLIGPTRRYLRDRRQRLLGSTPDLGMETTELQRQRDFYQGLFEPRDERKDQ